MIQHFHIETFEGHFDFNHSIQALPTMSGTAEQLKAVMPEIGHDEILLRDDIDSSTTDMKTYRCMMIEVASPHVVKENDVMLNHVMLNGHPCIRHDDISLRDDIDIPITHMGTYRCMMIEVSVQ